MKLALIALVAGCATPSAFDSARSLHARAQADERAARCSFDEQAVHRCDAQVFASYEHALAAYEPATHTPDAALAHFYRAQILELKLRAMERAGDEYMLALAASLPDAFVRDAALGAVVAYDAARSRDVAGPLDKKLEAAADMYARLMGGGPDIPQIMFALARLARDRGDDARADHLLRTIAERYPRAVVSAPRRNRTPP